MLHESTRAATPTNDARMAAKTHLHTAGAVGGAGTDRARSVVAFAGRISKILRMQRHHRHLISVCMKHQRRRCGACSRTATSAHRTTPRTASAHARARIEPQPCHLTPLSRMVPAKKISRELPFFVLASTRPVRTKNDCKKVRPADHKTDAWGKRHPAREITLPSKECVTRDQLHTEIE